MLRIIVLGGLLLLGEQVRAVELGAKFDSIDGGTLSLSDWNGQPVLVVNTASQCAFARQYQRLQDLYDRYRNRGLVVAAVPRDDLQQELATNDEVRDFCELQYGTDFSMSVITHVTGPDAHLFLRSLKEVEGFAPRWNFNKVLIGPGGTAVETYGSIVDPLSASITNEIEELLP